MDAREFSNFIISRGADRECPACGHNGQWARVGATDSDLKLSTPDGTGMILAAGLVCQNCGLIRLHSVDVIRHALVDGDIDVPE